MCIRDRFQDVDTVPDHPYINATLERDPTSTPNRADADKGCLLYTSDAADERSSVDLGGRRIIKKKKEVRGQEGHRRNNTKITISDTRTML